MAFWPSCWFSSCCSIAVSPTASSRARRYEPLHWLRTALPLFIVDGFFLMLTYVEP